AQLVDIGALLANDHARPRRMNRHPALLVRTLDHDLGNRSLLQLLHQDFANLDVLMQQLAVLGLARIPARIPSPVDAKPQANRIDFLTHRSLPRPFVKRSLRPDERQSSDSKRA